MRQRAFQYSIIYRAKGCHARLCAVQWKQLTVLYNPRATLPDPEHLWQFKKHEILMSVNQKQCCLAKMECVKNKTFKCKSGDNSGFFKTRLRRLAALIHTS